MRHFIRRAAVSAVLASVAIVPVAGLAQAAPTHDHGRHDCDHGDRDHDRGRDHDRFGFFGSGLLGGLLNVGNFGR
ncbi:hypothetical protein NKH77_19980 [Streptomyces sp. M19]